MQSFCGKNDPVSSPPSTLKKTKQQRKLRVVNLACFPVQYQETYYKDVVERRDEGLCKFAYWGGFVVGAACARLEPLDSNKGPSSDVEGGGDGAATAAATNANGTTAAAAAAGSTSDRQRLYIMTLGVLAAYRGREIGTQLIQSILDHYERNKDGEFAKVDEIALHVQISNDDAIRFYTKRFGFEQGDMVENYYRRIDPPHCYLLFKKLP